MSAVRGSICRARSATGAIEEEGSRIDRERTGDGDDATGIIRRHGITRIEREASEAGMGFDDHIARREGEGLHRLEEPRILQNVLGTLRHRNRAAKIDDSSLGGIGIRVGPHRRKAAGDLKLGTLRNGNPAITADNNAVECPLFAGLHRRHSRCRRIMRRVVVLRIGLAVVQLQFAVSVGGIFDENRAAAAGSIARRTRNANILREECHFAARRDERNASTRARNACIRRAVSFVGRGDNRTGTAN